ncbi:ABC transporter ATP-binding protein [Kiritimatiella glycovorans]|uniref:Carnitine transport ATP-binding protein OpuCA n=1 Tax=Kiritimatiella glycovorans TaxID=1307763 RepID=A0A0G3EGR8_9BACT|nr:ABC transporter ATP-binding protein [Kiritimatiella glycovorans]AKJ65671.1 Carnitine transport ATP-binding protein OpuCA [Kiritimatiella glycovorans]
MITYESVTKTFGAGRTAVHALREVSFEVPEGEVVVLLGPSGCGKTTTLRLTNRLERLTSGRILLQGRDIGGMNAVGLRRRMGYVIQEIGLFPNQTIARNIAQVPRLLKWPKSRIEERVDEMLRMVNLEPGTFRDRYPAELSGGQQQRVGVARGLAHDPEVLLMDEPFGAVDPINRARIQDEFLALQARLKKTVLFVSHDIHEAVKMGDRVALFREGRLSQYDTPEALLTRPKDRFTAEFVGADRALKVLGLLRVRDVMEAPDTAGPEPGEEGPSLHREDLLREALSVMLLHEETELPVLDEEGNREAVITYRAIQSKLSGMAERDGETDR